MDEEKLSKRELVEHLGYSIFASQRELDNANSGDLYRSLHVANILSCERIAAKMGVEEEVEADIDRRFGELETIKKGG